MQERVYQINTHNVDELKHRLIQIWCNLDRDIIDAAIHQRCKDEKRLFRAHHVNSLAVTV